MHKCEVLAILNEFELCLVGHDEEVHSLSWITVHGDAILASSSRDRKIKIWNVGDGTLMKELEIPKAKGRLTDNQKDRLWLTAMWLPFRAENTFGIEQDVTMRIISGSYMGQMFLWEWKRYVYSNFKNCSFYKIVVGPAPKPKESIRYLLMQN